MCVQAVGGGLGVIRWLQLVTTERIRGGLYTRCAIQIDVYGLTLAYRQTDDMQSHNRALRSAVTKLLQPNATKTK